MSSRARCLHVLTAILLGIAIRGSPLAAEGEATTIWSFPEPGVGAVQMDLPSSWTEVTRDKKHGTVRFRPRDGPKAELTLVVSRSNVPDPDFNGPARLRSLVMERGEEFLDQAMESRVTVRDLRGPSSAGCYWSLRDRAPRKPSDAYLIRGMLGTGTTLLDFTLLTPRADMPEIRQALKMIAGAREAEPGARSPIP